ncbi:hypothetical protein FHS89_000653 [Rubricella aquisinus]|uniref:Uncharacterized protein n=1 Tax=Rubricella aquisinus TaxID=2028108 RepID=A0A840X1V3_9RHOB|nr:hypothetical protein [Rubricella aquisinus]MBB5514647.1 hypothetical protein [Rubricella aquisinus]
MTVFALSLPAMGQAMHETPEIEAALSGRSVVYGDGVVQSFDASGETVYGTSRGRWAARGGSYCSLWPPSDDWACYRVTRIEGGIRFTDGAGRVFDGTYQK